jgi:hypothetical protein
MACVRYTQERKSVREKVAPDDDDAGQRRMSHFLMTRKKKGRPLAVAIGGASSCPISFLLAMAIFFPFFLFTQICIRPFLFLYFSFPALV